nr:hypothetical protein L204_03624 [Cryptococcus depauperatus CBS 7855]
MSTHNHLLSAFSLAAFNIYIPGISSECIFYPSVYNASFSPLSGSSTGPGVTVESTGAELSGVEKKRAQSRKGSQDHRRRQRLLGESIIQFKRQRRALIVQIYGEDAQDEIIRSYGRPLENLEDEVANLKQQVQTLQEARDTMYAGTQPGSQYNYASDANQYGFDNTLPGSFIQESAAENLSREEWDRISRNCDTGAGNNSGWPPFGFS